MPVDSPLPIAAKVKQLPWIIVMACNFQWLADCSHAMGLDDVGHFMRDRTLVMHPSRRQLDHGPLQRMAACCRQSTS